MLRPILFLSLLVIPVHHLSAQVTVEAAGLVPRLGEVRQLVSETIDQPLSGLDLAYGHADGPQMVDLTAELTGAERLVMTQSVLSPGSAPDHELYPAADYVLYIQGSSPDLEDTWYFVEDTPEGGRVLGTSGGNGTEDPLTDLIGGDSQSGFPTYEGLYPLTFGEAFGPLEIPLDMDLGDFRRSGAMTLQGAVDAWGTVVVPAGRFEALRMHQWGVAHFVFAGGGADTLRFTEELDGYTWISPGVGQVAAVQEVRIDFPPEMGVPLSYLTQVTRLQSYQPGPTAVALTTWGRIKAGF
ncbi:MAG: hypothetical protein ABIL09_12085 [Gemmatimonadota bacterium]